MPAQTMTRVEFEQRFRARRYTPAKYRSLDTVAPLRDGETPEVPNPIFTLSMILSASYPDLALITN